MEFVGRFVVDTVARRVKLVDIAPLASAALRVLLRILPGQTIDLVKMTDAELLQALDDLKATLIAVATGGPRIQDVQHAHAQQYDRVQAELGARRIEAALPYRDLWQWYGKWSTDIPSYQPRRTYIATLFEPIIARVQSVHVVSYTPTGWERVDRAVQEIAARFAVARNEEHFQAVALLCREVFISLAQSVYDATKHPTLDGVKPSATDAKRMLEAYVAVELAGGSNEDVRRHAKAALDLAVNLQHKRSAAYRDGALCVEATTSIVKIVAIIDGRTLPA